MFTLSYDRLGHSPAGQVMHAEPDAENVVVSTTAGKVPAGQTATTADAPEGLALMLGATPPVQV